MKIDTEITEIKESIESQESVVGKGNWILPDFPEALIGADFEKERAVYSIELILEKLIISRGLSG